MVVLPDPPHALRCAARLRRHAPTEGWSEARLVEEIHRHCGHTRLRAHRLARGWTLEYVATQIRELLDGGNKLRPSRISKWELGLDEASRHYRDALCRLYATGPVELGLSRDYHPTDEPDPAGEMRGAEKAGAAAPDRWIEPTSSAPVDDDEEAAMRRRGLLTGMLAGAGGALTGPVVEAVAAVRRRMDTTLSASPVSETTIAHWEAVANQYGRTYKSTAPLPYLVDVVSDFAEVQRIIDRQLPSGPRRDLCVVAARLATLVGMTMINLGAAREARSWLHTARLAADEAADSGLRAWVATRESVARLYFNDPQGAVEMAQQAQRLARSTPCVAATMAPSVEARARAQLAGGDARGEVLTALRRAEEAFTHLELRHTEDNTAYAFTGAQLHFYRSNAFTTIGDTHAAMQAQDAAMAAFGPHERLDPTLVQLDRATCIAREDVVAGVDHAANVLLALPDEHRPPIVVGRARDLAGSIPVARRSLPAVRNFHEVLALGAAPSP